MKADLFPNYGPGPWTSRDESQRAHEKWRADIHANTESLRANPHKVSGLPGHFRDGSFHRGDRPDLR